MTAIDPVDLLVFGPHPDDLEIGMAGTIAKQTSLGHRVGLCDLTEGEMGSNGTVAERLAEAQAAAKVLGARWQIAPSALSRTIRARSPRSSAKRGRGPSRCPTGPTVIRITSPQARC